MAVADELQEPDGRADAFEHDLQLGRGRVGEFLSADRAPRLEPLPPGRERPGAGERAVGGDEQLVQGEEAGDALLVGLELLPGVVDGRVLVRRVLQLDDPEGQAVQEQDDVGAVGVLVLGDGELVDREPVVGRGPLEVDDLRLRPADGALGCAVLDLDAPDEHAVEGAVASRERRTLGARELAEGALKGVSGKGRVQAREGTAQAALQHDLPVVVAFRAGALRARCRGRRRSASRGAAASRGRPPRPRPR